MPAAPPPPVRLQVSTLAQLDAQLDRALAALDVSCDASLAVLDGFEFAPPGQPPGPPDGAAYRDWQMQFYALVSGREGYDPHTCEQMWLDADKRHRPFPYYTRSSTVVGEQLMAVGFVVRALALPPRGRVLEFGSGFGLLTLELARTDFDVTAVEINPLYAELLAERAARERLELTIARAGMLDFRAARPFERVLFYESFHHCHDPVRMIAGLDALVAPGGAVLFAGEPVLADSPLPWGVRRDGRSLWAIRKHGWLELGFRTDYFLGLLDRHGWEAEIRHSADVPWQCVFVARRKSDRPRARAAVDPTLPAG